MHAPFHSTARTASEAGAGRRVPPSLYFLVSAVFHYLGPAFAVLLFRQVAPLGVAWLRIATAALVFALWRRPWRLLWRAPGQEQTLLLALGAVFALMNAAFYLAIARLPLATVGAVEFSGPIALAVIGARSPRNVAAVVIAAGGAWLLTRVQWQLDPWGLLWTLANCLLFTAYVVLGHRIARQGGASGVDRLGAAMLVALVAVSPIGLAQALPAFTDVRLLAAGAGVGICSSVIPYVCDQWVMARLPRATFALLLALLPAFAALIGIVVLRQTPSAREALGIALIVGAVALHREARG